MDRLGQGRNAFHEGIAELVEPERGPRVVPGPRHAPSEGFVIGDAEDQPFPALQNAHETPPGFDHTQS